MGHLVPTSGPDRERGEDAIRAMQLFLEQAREDDWSAHGRTVAVRHADSAGKGQGRTEATRLLAVNRVAALIVGPGVDNLEDVIAAARAQGTSVVVVDERVEASRAGCLVLGPNPLQRGQVLAGLASGKLKARRALVLVDRRHAIPSALADAFVAAFRDRGGQAIVTGVEEDESGPSLARVAAEKPDVVLLAVPAKEFLARLEGKGVPTMPILNGGEEAGIRSFADRIHPQHTVYHAGVFSALVPLPEAGKTWQKQYEKRHHQLPGRDAMLARDALSLLTTSLAESQRLSRESFQESLFGRETFESLTGKVRWKEGRPLRTLYVTRWEKGKAEAVQTVSAE